jgi:hypothetical protein
MPTIEDKARELIQANPQLGRRGLAKALGIGESVARRLLRGDPPAKAAKASKPVPKIAGVLTLADLRARYDVAEKIRRGIAEHLVGQDAFVDDSHFRELCGVHVQHWRRYASLEEFECYQIKLSGVLHWADKKHVVRAREVFGLP